jgi:hypothetical protein
MAIDESRLASMKKHRGSEAWYNRTSKRMIPGYLVAATILNWAK